MSRVRKETPRSPDQQPDESRNSEPDRVRGHSPRHWRKRSQSLSSFREARRRKSETAHRI